MLIAIYNRRFDATNKPIMQQLFITLAAHKCDILLFEGMIDNLKKFDLLPKYYKTFSKEQPLTRDVRCLLSLCDDGTILDTITFVGDKNILILGINMGRLGFLAGTGLEEVEYAISQLQANNYSLDKRSLVHLDSSAPLFPDSPFGDLSVFLFLLY